MTYKHKVRAAEVLVAGAGSGMIKSTDQMLSFWGGYDPATGVVLDHRHPLRGECLAGNVLVLPKGKGSSTGSAVLVDALVAGNAPSAILMKEPDEIISLGVVVFEEFYERAIPVIVLGDDDFTMALRSSYADINPDGTVILHESAN